MMEKKQTKPRDASKLEHAELLYMAGVSCKEIAEKVGISPNTVTSWITAFGWRERKAAKSITRTELVNKLLVRIDELASVPYDPSDKNADDRISKIASTIDKLDRQVTVVDDIETFISFNKYLEQRQASDKRITTPIRKEINRLQDEYINSRISGTK